MAFSMTSADLLHLRKLMLRGSCHQEIHYSKLSVPEVCMSASRAGAVPHADRAGGPLMSTSPMPAHTTQMSYDISVLRYVVGESV